MDLPPDNVFYGRSAAMESIRRKVERVVSTDVPLLIEGENGTGKEVLARVVHASSTTRCGPFVKVNCAAIPSTLIESELFGYEAGAFTGANVAKPGRVEMASGGTLFLDEIGNLELGIQAKLLQFLQDGKFYRIGASEEAQVQTRIICATNRDLREETDNNRFRMDLFYRINVIHFKLPPLRERQEDIPLLIDYFLSRYAGRFQQPVAVLPAGSLQILQRHSWPGNIRELENCMARCVVLGAQEALQAYMPKQVLQTPRATAPASGVASSDSTVLLRHFAADARRELERDIILKALQAHNWNRQRTAAALKISYRTLLYKVRQAGIPAMRQRHGSAHKIEPPSPTAA